jgi:C4-dicarboxylate transporter
LINTILFDNIYSFEGQLKINTIADCMMKQKHAFSFKFYKFTNCKSSQSKVENIDCMKAGHFFILPALPSVIKLVGSAITILNNFACTPKESKSQYNQC